MNESWGWMPEWMIDEKLGDKSEEFEQEIKSIPSLEEAWRRLNSTELDPRYEYYPQIWVIMECLRDAEAFWDYANDVTIVNELLFDIRELKQAQYDYENFLWEKEWETWKKINKRYIWKQNDIIDYLVTKWRTAERKMVEDLKDKSEQEREEIIKQRSRKFIDLVMERVKYVEPKK